MSRELEGRVIAIAGAGGSLGPYVARRLAADGARLWLTDRDEDRLNAVAEEVGAQDARVVDLLDEAAARAWADAIGEVDAVAHLVGGWRGGQPLPECPLDDWAFLNDLLVRTVQHTTRAFAEPLKRAGAKGRFVVVSSPQADRPTTTNAAYGAAKAAAEAWTLAFADELAESGATANILRVNAIVTPETREANPDKAYKTFADARHMADAIAFLCSESASKMNGQRLSLHG